MPRRFPLRTAAFLLRMIVALSSSWIAAPAALAQGQLQIEGTRWVSVDRSRGDLGWTYVFLHGGVVLENFGAMTGFTYRQSGDTLIMSTDGQEINYKVEISNQSMTMQRPDGQVRRFVRAGPRTSTPELQGLWAFRHETGAQADILFGESGQGLMRVLLKGRRGTFSTRTDGTVLIEMPGSGAQSARLDKDVLEIRGEQRTLRFKRG